MDTGRAWGLGLIALGGAVGLLLLLWLLVTAASGELRAGGFVLGLVLVAVLALPLLGGGYYLLQRSATEAQAAARFEARRRLLEGDRLFRQQTAATLRQLAEQAARTAQETAVAERLQALAARIEQARRDEVAWYEASPLADDDLPLVRRFDDALQAETDRLAELLARAGRGEPVAGELEALLDRWERTYRQREALLVSGRRAPAVAPEALLRARPPTRGAAALGALALGDAVTVDFEDYLVQGVVSYFAEGRTWRLFILRDGDTERWLWSAPGGLSWAVLEPLATAPAPGAPQLEAEGVSLALVESGSATADLVTVGGTEQGIPVDYWRYTGPDRRLAWVERWPRETRAGVGRETFPEAIAVWPRSAPVSSG
jgi:hypothetical protein